MTKITVGLDVGDRFSEVCVLDEAGVVIERGRVPTRLSALEHRFGRAQPMRIVLETGKQSPWMSRQLEAWGHEVVVANARRVHLISRERRKSDRSDAETLARMGRIDPQLLRPVRHRGEVAQHDLAVLRARDALVRGRTLLINHVRGVVASTGGTLPKCSADAFARKAPEHLEDAVRAALAPLLETIGSHTAQIRTLDREIERLSAECYPETALLRQVPGVGPITALAFVLVIEDPRRFRSGRSVAAFLGLVPGRRASGDSDPQRRITKTGDRMLRTLLVQAAHYTLGPFGPPSDLRSAGERIASGGGRIAKKRAVVAVARKLAVLLHALWVSGTVYEPFHNSSRLAA